MARLATELGKERTPENQALLLQNLDVRDPTLFAKMAQSLGQIGDELGIQYVLEGTVRWDHPAGGASRVRISPRLVELQVPSQPHQPDQQQHPEPDRRPRPMPPE